MAEQVNTTPEKEEKNTPEVPTEEKQEATVGEVIETVTQPEAPKAKETVGLDKFLEIKKENKELKQAIKDLESKISEGATVSEVTDDIETIAEEFDVDKKFLSKLTKVMETKLDSKLKPLTEKEKKENLDSAFKTHFAAAMERLPDYKDVVNPAVIKSLSLDPANSKKTFTQLIEETYGNAIVGKRTIETTTPRGGKEPEGIDYDRARRDTTYFKEIMADPARKKEYNSGIEKRIGF